MILIDSSSWIHMLRPNGDPSVKNRVVRHSRRVRPAGAPSFVWSYGTGRQAIVSGKFSGEFERLLPELAIDHAVWNAAFDLARRARSTGMSIPATDILITACARHHQVEIEHADSDFSRLEKL